MSNTMPERPEFTDCAAASPLGRHPRAVAAGLNEICNAVQADLLSRDEARRLIAQQYAIVLDGEKGKGEELRQINPPLEAACNWILHSNPPSGVMSIVADSRNMSHRDRVMALFDYFVGRAIADQQHRAMAGKTAVAGG